MRRCATGRGIVLTAALLTAGGMRFAAASEAGGQQRFRSLAELVTVDVLVTDGRRIVTGLTRDDFELRDSGVPQTIEQLYLDQLPVNVIMVLDTSGSVAGERLAALKKGASAVIDRLRAEDRAAVVSFSHRLDLPMAMTGDRAALGAAVAALEPGGRTALRDATYAGLALRSAEATRTLLLLFSDGVDTASLLGEQRVLEIARRSDVTIYAVGIRDQPAMPRGGSLVSRPVRSTATDDRFLKALADETGGRVLYAEHDRDIGPAFRRVLDEFNNRYVLGFTPSGVPGAGWHPVDVRLKNRRGHHRRATGILC